MTPRQFKRTHFKNVRKQFNKFYNTCNSLCETWDVSTVPMAALNELVPKLKLSVDSSSEETNTIVSAHNDVIDSLLTTFKNTSKAMGSNGVTLEYLKYVINLVLNSYKCKMK